MKLIFIFRNVPRSCKFMILCLCNILLHGLWHFPTLYSGTIISSQWKVLPLRRLRIESLENPDSPKIMFLNWLPKFIGHHKVSWCDIGYLERHQLLKNIIYGYFESCIFKYYKTINMIVCILNSTHTAMLLSC